MGKKLVINNREPYKSIEWKEIRLGKSMDEGKEVELNGKVQGEAGVPDARNDGKWWEIIGVGEKDNNKEKEEKEGEMEIETGDQMREPDNTQLKELDQNMMLGSWRGKKTKEPRGG